MVVVQASQTQPLTKSNLKHAYDDMSRKRCYPDKQKGIEDYSNIWRNKKGTLEP